VSFVLGHGRKGEEEDGGGGVLTASSVHELNTPTAALSRPVLYHLCCRGFVADQMATVGGSVRTNRVRVDFSTRALQCQMCACVCGD
jgi:hypothetical protein